MRIPFFGKDTEPDPDPTPEDLVAKIRSWDGEPIIHLDTNESIELHKFVPHWDARVVGPHLPWVGHRASMSIVYMVQPSREAARETAMEQAHEMCIQQGLAWNEEEWTITYLEPNNVN